MAIEEAEVVTSNTPTSIGIKPLAMTIGAEITGVEISSPLSGEVIKEIRNAFLKWKVLFFRDQKLNHDQHIAFSKQFGKCTPAHAVYGHQDDRWPEIYTVDRDRRDKRYKGADLLFPWSGWHADVTPAINPPAISILRGDKMPPYGGDTQFADMVAAYKALSKTMQEFLDGLRGIHQYRGNAGVNTSEEYRKTLQKNLLISEHPLVRVHPETGKKAIYCAPSFIESIVDLTPTESEALLVMLKTHVARPEFNVRFKWTDHSLTMWDNRQVLHMGPKDIINSEFPREIHRTTLMGDIPVGPDGRTSTSIEGNPIEPQR